MEASTAMIDQCRQPRVSRLLVSAIVAALSASILRQTLPWLDNNAVACQLNTWQQGPLVRIAYSCHTE